MLACAACSKLLVPDWQRQRKRISIHEMAVTGALVYRSNLSISSLLVDCVSNNMPGWNSGCAETNFCTFRCEYHKGKDSNLRCPQNWCAGTVDPVKYMPDRASKLSCAWFVQRFVLEHNAETMQAVPNMLELVPKGVNKGSGMRKLLANLELPVEVCFCLFCCSYNFSSCVNKKTRKKCGLVEQPF